MAGVEATPVSAPTIQSPKAQHVQPATTQPMNIDTPTSEPPQANGDDHASSQTPDSTKDISVAEFTLKLQQILQVIQGFDKQDVLGGVVNVQVDDDTKEVSVATIKDKLSDHEYKEIGPFKDDIVAILKNSISSFGQKSPKGTLAHQLLALVADLTADMADYNVRSNGKKRQAGEDGANASLVRDHEKMALFQRTMEGFVFSSASTISPQSLDVDVATVRIVPTASLMDAPLLKTVNTKPRKVQPLPKQRPRPAFGVEYAAYNPFLSFAPFIDTGGASMNAQETAIAYAALEARHAKRTRKIGGPVPGDLEAVLSIVAKHTSTSDPQQQQEPLNEEDLAGLEAEGINIKALLQPQDVEMQSAEDESPTHKVNGAAALATEESDSDFMPKAVEEAIQHNARLLAELQILQQKRFDDRSHIISEREKEIAMELQTSLAELLGRVPPSDVVTREAVEEAMRRIPYRESAFAGVLPPNRPFACPSNTTREGVPPTGTAYPNYRPQPSKPLPAKTNFVIPQVAMSPVINYTGGYTLMSQPPFNAFYTPSQPGPLRTFSRMRAATANGKRSTIATAETAGTPREFAAESSSSSLGPIVPRPFPPAHSRVSLNGQVASRKVLNGSNWRRSDASPCTNCGTAVSPIWRLGLNGEKLCNSCGQYGRKWRGQQRPSAAA